MTITTRLFTFFQGELVGEDGFGNRYFRGRRKAEGEREKRWVLFRGKPEPTKVPPEWHGWLHHTTDTVPSSVARRHYYWQKPHLPNLTGTQGAYVPPGHVLRGAKRDRSTSDYQAWKP